LSRINRPHRRSVAGEPAPSLNDEWFLFQTLIGAWPDEADADVHFVERVQAYMEKAVREAKQQTSWENANEDYEAALSAYIAAVLDPGNTAFREAFLPLQRRAAHLGFCKSLAFTLLELTSPGVPDIYQGDELLQLALVDPDNRRPVDFAARRDALDRLRAACDGGAAPAETLRGMLSESGRALAKLYVTWRCLELRRLHPMLFRRGDYRPLEAYGAAADRLCVYSRSYAASTAVVVAPCLTTGLGPDDLALGSAWGDTRIALPGQSNDGAWYELFTGHELRIDRDDAGRSVSVAELLQNFPIAMLVTPDLK
jgi:(1->4)-alpha-D-glucan 1-alpha-D-glucosylmutase